MDNKKNKCRLKYIDIIKAIGIFLVVDTHTNLFIEGLHPFTWDFLYFVCIFHMPLFLGIWVGDTDRKYMQGNLEGVYCQADKGAYRTVYNLVRNLYVGHRKYLCSGIRGIVGN